MQFPAHFIETDNKWEKMNQKSIRQTSKRFRSNFRHVNFSSFWDFECNRIIYSMMSNQICRKIEFPISALTFSRVFATFLPNPLQKYRTSRKSYPWKQSTRFSTVIEDLQWHSSDSTWQLLSSHYHCVQDNTIVYIIFKKYKRYHMPPC